MNAYETFSLRNYTVKLYQDYDFETPEQDSGLFIVTIRNCYFQLEHNDLDANGYTADKELCSRYWVFPLYAYVHSGVALSMVRRGQFSDPWDSGQIGFVFVAKSEWRLETQDTKRCVSARTAATHYVEYWNQYLSGDVWGYQITDSDGAEIDSCWGLFGLDYARKEATDAVPETACAVNGETEDIAHDGSLS